MIRWFVPFHTMKFLLKSAASRNLFHRRQMVVLAVDRSMCWLWRLAIFWRKNDLSTIGVSSKTLPVWSKLVNKFRAKLHEFSEFKDTMRCAIVSRCLAHSSSCFKFRSDAFWSCGSFESQSMFSLTFRIVSWRHWSALSTKSDRVNRWELFPMLSVRWCTFGLVIRVTSRLYLALLATSSASSRSVTLSR